MTPTRHMQRPWPGGWRSTSHRIAHSAGRRLSRQRHSSWSRQWSDTTGTSRTPGARAWSPQQGTMSCGSPPFERALMRTDHCQGIGGAGSGPSKGILVQCKRSFNVSRSWKMRCSLVDSGTCMDRYPYSLLERVNWTAWAACRSVGGMAISIGCAAIWACTMASALAIAPGSPPR